MTKQKRRAGFESTHILIKIKLHIISFGRYSLHLVTFG
jgi:hypothetical protein